MVAICLFVDASQTTVPVMVELSPSPSLLPTTEKATALAMPSPPCLILDDDSIPSPSMPKKLSSKKMTVEQEKSSAKMSKRSRDTDKPRPKEKIDEATEAKRKRSSEGTSSLVYESLVHRSIFRSYQEDVDQ
jgi:hypothetical protein